MLFSGDGDFRPLVEAIQRRGVRVTVVSTISTQPPMVADELRRQADTFVELQELESEICRHFREDREPAAERPRAREVVEREPVAAAATPHRGLTPANPDGLPDEDEDETIAETA